MNPLRRRLAATPAVPLLWLAGCATAPAGQTVLQAVARELPGNPPSYADASPEQARGGVRVRRDGRPLDPLPGLPLRTGDEVETLAGLVAVIRFDDGHEAVLLPGTRVRIGSLIADIGNLFVRVYEQARDRFKVKTRYVTAGVEGTSFWVRVEPGDRLTVGVSEGRVRLSSVEQRWPDLPVLPGEAVVALGAAAPTRAQAERAQLDAIVRQIGRLRLAPAVPRLPPR